MNRLIYSITALIISISMLSAQNNPDAEKVIINLLNSAKATAVKTNFSLVVAEKKSVTSQSTAGTFLIKGSKFMLEMNEMKVWFDGKTQWAYMLQSNEVSVTEPSESELAETNPMAILSGYKAKYNIQFSKVKSSKNIVVSMTPKRKTDILLVEVQVVKATDNLHSIKLYNKNGSTSTLTLTNFKKGIPVADAAFVFDKSKYKGVTMNDLR